MQVCDHPTVTLMMNVKIKTSTKPLLARQRVTFWSFAKEFEVFGCFAGCGSAEERTKMLCKGREHAATTPVRVILNIKGRFAKSVSETFLCETVRTLTYQQLTLHWRGVNVSHSMQECFKASCSLSNRLITFTSSLRPEPEIMVHRLLIDLLKWVFDPSSSYHHHE